MKLIKGDCIEKLSFLIKEGIKVDAIITDPPYGTTACAWDAVVPFDEMWKCLKAIRKEKIPTILFGSEPFSSALRISNIKEYKYDWVWDKVKPSGFQVAKYRPMMRQENIMVFGKGSINYYPIMEERSSIKKSRPYSKSDSSPLAYDDGKMRCYIEKYPQSILVYSNAYQKGKVHETQKPVALMMYLIKTYSKEGDTVLDFTMGSGSTGVACKLLDRHFIGIEKDDTYFDIARDRIDFCEEEKVVSGKNYTYIKLF